MNPEDIINSARGVIDYDLLTETGEGGLLSTGYFADRPLIAIIDTGEQLHYLVQNLKKGLLIDGSDGLRRVAPPRKYRSALLVTERRIIIVIGGGNNTGGDWVGSIPYSDLETINCSTGIRKHAVRLKTASSELTFHTRTESDVESIEDYVETRLYETSESDGRSSQEDTDSSESRNSSESGGSSSRSIGGDSDNDASGRPTGLNYCDGSHSPSQPTAIGRRMYAYPGDREQSPKSKNQDQDDRSEEEDSSSTRNTASINVVNPDGEPIKSADVNIAGEPHPNSVESDEIGLHEITLSERQNHVDLEVTKEGYEPVTGRVPISGDSTIEVTLEPLAETATEPIQILIQGESGAPPQANAIRVSAGSYEAEESISGSCRRTFEVPKHHDSITVELLDGEQTVFETSQDLGSGRVFEVVAPGLDSGVEQENSSALDADEMISELERLEKEESRKLTRGLARSSGKFNPREYEEVFGTWSAAKEKLQTENTNDDSSPDTERTNGSKPDSADREALLEELQRLDEEFDRPLTSPLVAKESEYSVEAFTGEFGEWTEAKKAYRKRQENLDQSSESTDAGQKDTSESSDDPGVNEPPARLQKKDRYTKSDVIDEIQRVREKLEERPLTSDLNEHGAMSSAVAYNFFDSWDDAVSAATTSDRETGSTTVESSNRAENGASNNTQTRGQGSESNGGGEPELSTLLDKSEGRVDDVVLRVDDVDQADGEYYTAHLTVSSADLEEVGFNIWEKHDIDADFEPGEVYHFQQARLKSWGDMTDGDVKISSTRDMTVAAATGSSASSTSEAQTTSSKGESGSSNKASNEVNGQEDDEETILDEIMEEVDF